MSAAALGLLLRLVDGGAQIRAVVGESPAYVAGLRAGMVIEQVDGVPVAGRTMEELSAAIAGPRGTERSLVVDGVVKRVPLGPVKRRQREPSGVPSAWYDQVIAWNTHRPLRVTAWLNPSTEEGRTMAAQIQELVRLGDGQVGVELRLVADPADVDAYGRARRLACEAKAGIAADELVAAIVSGGPVPSEGESDLCLAAPPDRGDFDVARVIGVGKHAWVWAFGMWFAESDDLKLQRVVMDQLAPTGRDARCLISLIGQPMAHSKVVALGAPERQTETGGGRRLVFRDGVVVYGGETVSAVGFLASGPQRYHGPLPLGLYADDPPESLARRLVYTDAGWVGNGWTFESVALAQDVDAELRIVTVSPSWAPPSHC